MIQGTWTNSPLRARFADTVTPMSAVPESSAATPVPTSDTLTNSNGRARRDALRIQEEAAFLPAGLLITTHLPSGRAPVGGVVICSSLHADFLANYRKEVLLARALCESGLAVQRFHYRGTGNSRGLPEEVTMSSLVEDGVLAAENLARTGVQQVAFLGIRFGALVAASLAAETDCSLALWEPVVDGNGYFREAFRAVRMRELKDGKAEPRSGDSLLEELHSTGAVDVLGYTVHQALYDSAAAQRLTAVLGTRPRRMLLVQVSNRKELKREFHSMTETWDAAGITTECQVVLEEESWWFVGEDWLPEERRASTRQILDVTTEWLVRDATRHEST